MDRIEANLYGGNDAVGCGVDDGHGVSASIGYVGVGPVGSDSDMDGIVADRDGGYDCIGRRVDHRD